MKKNFAVLLIVLAFSVVIFGGCTESEDLPDEQEEVIEQEIIEETEETAEEEIDEPDVELIKENNKAAAFLNKFLAGDMADAFELLNEPAKELMGEAVLEDLRIRFTSWGGEFIEHLSTEVHHVANASAYDFTMRQFSGIRTLRVSLDDAGEVQGFFGGISYERVMPEAELPDGVSEIDIIVNKGTALELPGKLTFPANASGAIPAVILVHGSGANDMDSSLFGHNMPFRDIAYGLAERGIAVLRYDKRAFVHPHPPTTVSEETIDDAVAAKAALLEQSGALEFSNIYVAGLSLGGVLGARIAEEGEYDGAILLAGSPRAFYEILYDQNVQAINESLKAGEMSQDDANDWFDTLDELLEEARNTPNPGEVETVFELPGVYMQSFIDSLPLTFIARNDTPVLILQGSRDFQIFADRDFKMFVDGTQGMAHVETKLYDNVNHLFMQSQTEYNDLREYMVRGNVDERVIIDMADWIIRNSR